MGLSCRRYLVDLDERVLRMKNTTFDGLLRDPDLHRMPALAGQRVRLAELLVEVSGRTVLHIVRRVYLVLTFDPLGRLDTDRFQRQQFALAGVAIDGVLAQERPPGEVLDAADRFVAQGGRWQPTHALAQRIDAVALGGM
jgi:hypothetical protein